MAAEVKGLNVAPRFSAAAFVLHFALCQPRTFSPGRVAIYGHPKEAPPTTLSSRAKSRAPCLPREAWARDAERDLSSARFRVSPGRLDLLAPKLARRGGPSLPLKPGLSFAPDT
jgi:hypothetical protein